MMEKDLADILTAEERGELLVLVCGCHRCRQLDV